MKIIAQGRKLTMGIDASTKSLRITVMDGPEIIKEASVPYKFMAIKSFLSRFPECRIRSVYEAGSIGFWLHHTLVKLGVDNTVTPPSKTPRSQDDRVKTDRRDSRKLAHMHYAGLLKAVHIPSPQRCAERQLVRARRQMVAARTRVMAQMNSLLVFHHIEVPEGLGKRWSRAYQNWLRSESFEDVDGGQYLRITLDAQLKLYDHLKEQTKQLQRQIREMIAGPRYRQRAEVLQALSGVGKITAPAILTEIGSMERFANSQQFTSYLGLTPSEDSSGDRRRQGHITKCGNAHLRGLLIECALAWIRKDRSAATTFGRIARRRDKGRAIVAMARRLATRIYWQLLPLKADSSG